MSIEFVESWDSKQLQTPAGGSTSATREYYAIGSGDPAVVQSVINTSGLLFQFAGMFANDTAIEPLAPNLCKVVVSFGKLDSVDDNRTNTAPEPIRNTGEYVFSFSTTGGTFHVTEAKSQAKYPGAGSPGEAPSCGNTIGWREGESPEGVDIVVPQTQFTIRKRVPYSTITINYVKTLRNATGKTNSDTFLGFAADELLFLGAEGQQTSAGDTELTFHFTAGENLTGQTVAGISSVAKKAHQYLWVKYGRSQGTDAIEPIAQGVYVAQVYDQVAFSTLGV
jgi:hypothetical protein